MTAHGHLCILSSLDSIPKKDRGDISKVLAALNSAGRFSAFEVCEKLAGTLSYIEREKLATFDRAVGYPWTKVALTDAGLAELREETACRASGDACDETTPP